MEETVQKTRETPESSMIGRVVDVLEAVFPDRPWDDFSSELVARGFYGASLQDQSKAYVRLAVELSGRKADKVFTAFLESDSDRLHALAAETAWFIWKEEPGKALARLRKTALKPGTWARDWTAMMVHRLVCSHGAETILDFIRTWAREEDEGLRRLVFESVRPHLPLVPPCRELAENPGILRNLIETSLDETSPVVRESIVRLLHDVARDNPPHVLEWAEAWRRKYDSPALVALLAEGLRSLTRDGNSRAFDVLDYKADVQVRAAWDAEPPEDLVRNQVFQVRARVESDSQASVKVMIQGRLVHGSKPSEGDRTKLADLLMAPGGKAEVEWQVHFVDNPKHGKERGDYRLQILVNNRVVLDKPLLYRKMKKALE